uniref:Uncharacterized protein n=1 Tax=Caenorhabditis japonica TaxID=281687 RepID=A0A8R1I1R9_CAEJA
MESVESVTAQLNASGLSQSAIDGFSRLWTAAHGKIDHSNKEAVVAGVKALIGEISEFMKTQSEADQAIYNVIIEKKKAEFRAANGLPPQ